LDLTLFEVGGVESMMAEKKQREAYTRIARDVTIGCSCEIDQLQQIL